MNLHELINEFNSYEEEKDNYINSVYQKFNNLAGLMPESREELEMKAKRVLNNKYGSFTKTGIRILYHKEEDTEYAVLKLLTTKTRTEAGYGLYNKDGIIHLSPYIKKNDKIKILNHRTCAHGLVIPIEIVKVDYEAYGIFKTKETYINGKWKKESIINKEPDNVILIEKERRVDLNDKISFEKALRTHINNWYIYQQFKNEHGENIHKNIIKSVIKATSKEDPEIGLTYVEIIKDKIKQDEETEYEKPLLNKYRNKRLKINYEELGEIILNIEEELILGEYEKEGLIECGNKELEKGRPNNAIMAYEKAGKEELITLGNKLLEEGWINSAIKAYEKAGKDITENKQGLIKCGNRLLEEEMINNAIKAYEKAGKEVPKNLEK